MEKCIRELEQMHGGYGAVIFIVFYIMIRRPRRSTPLYSSAASDVYEGQFEGRGEFFRGPWAILLRTVGDYFEAVAHTH